MKEIQEAIEKLTQYVNDLKEGTLYTISQTPLITETLNQVKCSECGVYFDKKEIIIQGDVDTCDDCLCPE